jgi:hypothetical protein
MEFVPASVALRRWLLLVASRLATTLSKLITRQDLHQSESVVHDRLTAEVTHRLQPDAALATIAVTRFAGNSYRLYTICSPRADGDSFAGAVREPGMFRNF